MKKLALFCSCFSIAMLSLLQSSCTVGGSSQITGTVVNSQNDLQGNLPFRFCYNITYPFQAPGATEVVGAPGNYVTTDCADVVTDASGVFHHTIGFYFERGQGNGNPLSFTAYLEVNNQQFAGQILPGNRPSFEALTRHAGDIRFQVQ